MRVAVITPYFKEDQSVLERCLDSVANQTYPCHHILVSDGFPSSYIDERCEKYKLDHIKLPVAHNDYGDTPRVIGSASAITQGYNAICWLDVDNWFEPEHIETMVTLAQREVASVVTATRNLYRPDGSFLGVCTESNGESFNDTNCYFVTEPNLALSAGWGFKDKRASVVGDAYFWENVTKIAQQRVHSTKPTVNYITNFAYHYLQRNEVPPENAKIIIQTEIERFPVVMPYKIFESSKT